MRKKTIEGKYVKRPDVKCTFTRKRIIDRKCGYASVIHFLEGNKRLIINEKLKDNGADLCLVDEGYKWLNYLPDSENWCMTAMYNQFGEIIEWYFDISKSNFIDENGDPCLDDLFIDIVLFPDGVIVTLDEDELKEALNKNEITKDEYHFAYHIYNQIKKSELVDVTYMTSFCKKLLSVFDESQHVV